MVFTVMVFTVMVFTVMVFTVMVFTVMVFTVTTWCLLTVLGAAERHHTLFNGPSAGDLDAESYTHDHACCYRT